MKLDKKKRVHFIGVGGIGMSGIAYLLLKKGYKVSGSDLESNNLTRRIADSGGVVFQSHDASNISGDVGIVVYSTSISGNNPEMAEAKKRRIRLMHRSEVLGELFSGKYGIAVTGTHGKTTTTSLTAVMLYNLGLDPSAVIGGEVKEFAGNAILGKGKYFVAEADESDSSFLNLKPRIAVLTNLEMEHVDHFKSLDDAVSAFAAFVSNIKKGGTLFYNADDANLRKAAARFRSKRGTFGFSQDADIRPENIRLEGLRSSFDCVYKGNRLGRVDLKLPGRHNVLNALAAILVGLELGREFERIAGAIKDFGGAKRRLEVRSETDGVILIDDYAHHPTEIRAVVAACRNLGLERLVAVFQPHRYTRTKLLAAEFGRCFEGVDKLILTDIFASSEPPIDGVSVKLIYDKVKASGFKDVVILKKAELADHVMKLKKKGDVVLIMGAGDIKKVADELADELNNVHGIKKVVKGKVVFNKILKDKTSFKIGGPADIWVEPADIRDLKEALAYLKINKIPYFVMGNGSNLLVKDSGFRGAVIRLSSPYFREISVDGNIVKVSAGFSLPKLVRFCCERALAGTESLVGIPGTVGGAIFMNAGGASNPIYSNIGDLIRCLKAMDCDGNVRTIEKKDLVFGYRSSNLEGLVIIEAELTLDPDDKTALLSRCSNFLKMKIEKQVLDAPSAGCVFKNPEFSQFTCGQMIDTLGLKGARVGGAEISEKHANFIINKKNATCEDVMKLIRLIKGKVKESYNAELELEVKIV